jgi:hypothetical protein
MHDIERLKRRFVLHVGLQRKHGGCNASGLKVADRLFVSAADAPYAFVIRLSRALKPHAIYISYIHRD